MRLIVYALDGSNKGVEHEIATMIASHILKSSDLQNYVLVTDDKKEEIKEDEKTG